MHRCFHVAGIAAAAAAVLLPVLLAARPAAAAMNRFYLVDQSDFGAKCGFYLDFENESAGDAPCKLATLKMILASGDGNAWNFPGYTPPQGWRYDHDYVARAIVGGPDGAVLYLDGQRVASAPTARFAPQDVPLKAGVRPGWASGAAEYVIRQTSLRLEVGGGKPLAVPFPALAARPLPVYLFEPQDPARQAAFHPAPGAPVTIEATFRIVAYPTDLHALAPFVDRYGQSRQADWPGKVHTDADLARAMREETRRNAAWGKPKGYDAYGGYALAPWHEKPTGFYRTVRHGGHWWLISPDGNPTFYTGLCTAPAPAWDKTPTTGREYLFAELPARNTKAAPGMPDLWARNVWGDGADVEYAALHSMNLIRKYGPDRWADAAKASLATRLSAWGFSGMGKWCETVGKMPQIPVLGVRDVPKLIRHIDVFDPKVRNAFAASLAKQIAPRKGDPTLVGWSYGNEYDEIITRDEVKEVLAKHPDSPAAAALREQAAKALYGGDAVRRGAAWKSAIPGADIEAMRRFYADRYYAFLYQAVKQADPNHLYLGFWIVPGWWENEADWSLIAPHCDVIGYDHYAPTFADANLTRLMAGTDKPVLCGEFSFPPLYDGTRGFGRYDAANARDDADAGAHYARWVHDAATNPYCVGVAWFQYRDEPITGRGPGHGPDLVYGEHYAFGLVDVTDRPKWDLVTRVRAANLQATPERLMAAAATGGRAARGR